MDAATFRTHGEILSSANPLIIKCGRWTEPQGNIFNRNFDWMLRGTNGSIRIDYKKLCTVDD